MTTIEQPPVQFSPEEVQDYVDRGLANLWVHTQQYTDLAKPDGMKIFVKGEGIWLWDMKGRRFIDAMSGLWVTNIGHGRPELAEAAAEQMRNLGYINTFAYTSMPAIDLAAKIATLLPSNLNKLFFANSGSEAVDTAIRFAKTYQYNIGEKKRFKVISRRGSYHGMSGGALSVNFAQYTNRVAVEPLIPGAVPVEGVNCYRCPFEKTYPDCDVYCARTVERAIQYEKPETIAAFIGEPISSANGAFVPPPGYWATIRQLCDKYGILLIWDEVINGFGRTGKWFAAEHFPEQPDLMTMAKGISSGYLPISGVAVSDKVAQAFVGDKSKTFPGGITFGTHPVSCAVALRNIEIMEAEGLVDNAARVGAYLKQRIEDLMAVHPTIGVVNGIGLMLSVEIVKDRTTRETFTEADGMADKLSTALFEEGILCRAGTSINIAPPLCITEAEADDLVARLDRALTFAERAVGVAV
jgi:adenosylmethionine-8-amino-7-oxononanoate aminotransferase